MTKLTYINHDNDTLGTALFYYPGRDGWFLVDNIEGNNSVIYLLLVDACPKITIKDSSMFIVVNHYEDIPKVDKTRWLRIANNDDYNIVKQQNKEYGSVARKSEKKSKVVYSRPKW